MSLQLVGKCNDSLTREHVSKEPPFTVKENKGHVASQLDPTPALHCR